MSVVYILQVKNIPILNKYFSTDFVAEQVQPEDNNDNSIPVKENGEAAEIKSENGGKLDGKSGQAESSGQSQFSNEANEGTSEEHNGKNEEKKESNGEQDGHTNTVFAVEYDKSETARITKRTVNEDNAEETKESDQSAHF